MAIKQRKSLGGDQWAEDGWRVDADYCTLEKPVPIGEIGAKLAALHLNGGPVNKSGGVNQGYLFSLAQEAADTIDCNYWTTIRHLLASGISAGTICQSSQCTVAYQPRQPQCSISWRS